MTATKQQTVVITLTLDQTEAAWLRSLMQNPICCKPENEDLDEKEYRENLFTALTNAFRS